MPQGASFIEWEYLPVDEAYFDAFWARIPDEYQARIGDGIRGGAVVVEGYRFRPVGLAHGKGPYQLVGQDTAARRPSPHWEYFIQLAEFLRLMKLPMPPGHTLGFEDGLMVHTSQYANQPAGTIRRTSPLGT